MRALVRSFCERSHRFANSASKSLKARSLRCGAKASLVRSSPSGGPTGVLKIIFNQQTARATPPHIASSATGRCRAGGNLRWLAANRRGRTPLSGEFKNASVQPMISRETSLSYQRSNPCTPAPKLSIGVARSKKEDPGECQQCPHRRSRRRRRGCNRDSGPSRSAVQRARSMTRTR